MLPGDTQSCLAKSKAANWQNTFGLQVTLRMAVLRPYSRLSRANNYLDKDGFKFHLRQLRINIEYAFGMLANRWGILWKPMRCPLHKIAPVVAVCMKLHNVTIDHQNGMAAAPGSIAMKWLNTPLLS
jgi:hypothetical protein